MLGSDEDEDDEGGCDSEKEAMGMKKSHFLQVSK